jgi:hypothetical protein
MKGSAGNEFWIAAKLWNHKHGEDDDPAGEPFHPLAALFAPAPVLESFHNTAAGRSVAWGRSTVEDY